MNKISPAQYRAHYYKEVDQIFILPRFSCASSPTISIDSGDCGSIIFLLIKQKIQTLYDVGLGYIKLGQPSTTLSGGEAQRVKLATELSKRATGKTLYILDEPTTGLHIADVHKLVDILQRLVDAGNTIIVIEHNLDLIKTCDHIIDLGPEGGDAGGEVIAVGTPEQICKNERSYTGKFLKKYLEQ